MKNFEKMLAELDKLNLPKDKYALFGSSVIAIRGIRDSEDVDIVVKPELWQELTKKYLVENDKLIKIGNIEIYKTWLPWFEDTGVLIDDADIFKGHRVVKLEFWKKWKKEYNREKDQKDLKLVEVWEEGKAR